MPRSARIEYPGALYHVINRGNYRQDLFAVHRTAEAFERALFEAAERFGWKLHAYIVMSNHFHMALETPRGNLCVGMQWLQSVFANRFNRFSGGIGHVFQGRYKALVVQPGPSLLRVVDYIQLNPVRAGLVDLRELRTYRWGSFPKWFWKQDRRPGCLTDERWRREGGYGPGPGELQRYWSDLAARPEGNPQLREQLRKELCRGWMIGATSFARELLQGDKRATTAQTVTREGPPPETEAVWEALASRLVRESGRSTAELRESPKSAAWKLAIAAQLKGSTGVSNRWLAEKLHLGHPCSASRNIVKWQKSAK
jgi:putative transposase